MTPVPAPSGSARVPAWWLLAVLLYAPAVLFVDGRLPAPWPWEYVLGALTFAILAVWTTRLRPIDRLQVWICVGVATAFEILGSQIWGGYRYRFGTIPAFVPFGHGLVYVFAFSVAATPFFARRERALAYAVLAIACAWALAGVTVLPGLTHRTDWHGIAWLLPFGAAILFGPRKALFAGIFIAVADLEIAGTAFGAWTWLPVAPWIPLPSGNPPSAIAGGYTVIDGSVLLIVALLTEAARRRGTRRAEALTSLAGSS